jgi:hypothetical protein
MSVKTELVKEFLVGRIHAGVAERIDQPLAAEIEAALAKPPLPEGVERGGSRDPALAAKLARAGYLARQVETELFEPARQPPSALGGLLRDAAGDGSPNCAAASLSARLSGSEPAERPDPGDEHAMTWRIPGPGGHVRHYVALAAIDWLARAVVGDDDESAGARLKRCWLFGFFLRSCEDAARPPS